MSCRSGRAGCPCSHVHLFGEATKTLQWETKNHFLITSKARRNETLQMPSLPGKDAGTASTLRAQVQGSRLPAQAGWVCLRPFGNSYGCH